MVHKKEQVYCPVCKTDSLLGERLNTHYFDGHCEECMATFYYKPLKKDPYKVITDRQRRNTCHCSSCEGRLL